MRRARQMPHGQARDVALHEARKSARRARYAAEVALPASGQPARTFARQMKKIQSVVGDHQDTVIARQAARDLGIGAHLAGENAFTYGLLLRARARPGRTPPGPRPHRLEEGLPPPLPHVDALAPDADRIH